MNNFNRIAPIYDELVWLVFGRKLWKAQQCHLGKINPKDKVLILGGGTGRILDWLPACEVDYLEKSEAMIRKASKRERANFIHADFLSHELEGTYDWIICPFFLDCFRPDELDKCLKKIMEGLNRDGKLIVTDFQSSTFSHRFFVRLMISFFRLYTQLSANELLDLRMNLSRNGLIPIESRGFLNGLVFSDLYVLNRRKS